MSTQYNMKTIKIVAGVLGLGMSLVPYVSFAATATTATAKCTFTRDLELGVTGDDVKCLQKFLNTHGFVIAASGVGSVGHETGEYKTLTEAAVIKWQKANKLTPAIGYFGAQSRLFFKNGGASLATSAGTPAVSAPLIQVPASSGTTDPDAALAAQVAALKAQLEAAAAGKPYTVPATPVATLPAVTPAATTDATVVTPVTSTTSASDVSIRKSMLTVLDLIAKADKAVKKGAKGSSLTTATETLGTAKNDMFTAVRAYLTGDLVATTDSLAKVKKGANAAYTTISSATDKTRASKAIANTQDNYDSAKDDIATASDDGKIVTLSKKLLKQAASLMDDAQAAYDDEKYSDALDLSDEADSAVSDAVAKIGKKS